MPTTCEYVKNHQIFGGEAQFISCGKIANATVGNGTTETAIVSEDIPADLLNKTSMGFRARITGLIGSNGSHDVTLTARYGSTDILALTTVSLPDEDGKIFELTIEGQILTTGASGKVVATGRLRNTMTGMADVVNATAAAGASVDLTAAGSINVTAEWDGTHSTSTLTALTGVIEFFN